MTQQSEHHRRALDALIAAGGDIGKVDTRNMITLIHADLQEIRGLQLEQAKLHLEQAKILGEVKEILKAWNNAKGFVETIKMLGNVAKWVTAVGAACGIIWFWWKKG